MPLHRNGSTEMPIDREGLKKVGICIGNGSGSASGDADGSDPIFFDVPFDAWPRHASEVLVLLLYNQVDGVGGNPRPPQRRFQANSLLTKVVTEALTYDEISDCVAA